MTDQQLCLLAAFAFVFRRFCLRLSSLLPSSFVALAFTYVVHANLLAAEAEGAAGEVFNVACGARMTLNEMLDRLRTFTGNDVEVEYAPPRPGDVMHSLADISKARRVLGYEPKITAAEGLNRSVAWYRGTLTHAT